MAKTSHEVEVYEPGELQQKELTVDQLVERQDKIKEAMQKAMKEGVHYGKIPGTGSKPTLLKAGAETLASLFMFDPEYESDTSFDDEGRFHVKSKCILYHIPSGKRIASGQGYCSTGEKKYVRQGNSPDLFNTVVKMADKRAFVAAMLNATAASDAFTQDLEEDLGERHPVRTPITPETRANLQRELTLLSYAPSYWSEEQMLANARRSFNDPSLQSIEALSDEQGKSIIDIAQKWREEHPPPPVHEDDDVHAG